MTRNDAFEVFLAVVVEAIPETIPRWADRRDAIRQAAKSWCHAAVNDALYRTIDREKADG